jgi:hypothetical protein
MTPLLGRFTLEATWANQYLPPRPRAVADPVLVPRT